MASKHQLTCISQGGNVITVDDKIRTRNPRGRIMSRNSTPHIPRVALLVRGTDSIVAVTKRNAEEQAIQTYFEQQGIEDPTPAQMSEARRSLGFQLQPR